MKEIEKWLETTWYSRRWRRSWGSRVVIDQWPGARCRSVPWKSARATTAPSNWFGHKGCCPLGWQRRIAALGLRSMPSSRWWLYVRVRGCRSSPRLLPFFFSLPLSLSLSLFFTVSFSQKLFVSIVSSFLFFFLFFFSLSSCILYRNGTGQRGR